MAVTASQLQAEIDALSAAILKADENGGITDYSVDGTYVRRVSVDVLERIRSQKEQQLAQLTSGGGPNFASFARRS